jgi:hypothetical protein
MLLLYVVVLLTACMGNAAGLKIEVIEGQNAINNISRNKAYEPIVEVRDEQDQPVAGATVTFTLPAVGASGVFTDGSKTLIIQTDTTGRAIARGLHPNNQVGQFEIRINANSDGRTASTVVTQTNAAPAVVQARSGKKLAIVLGLIGGGAAAAAAVAGGGGGGGSSSPRPTTPPQGGGGGGTVGTVTPGTPGFGPPQ